MPPRSLRPAQTLRFFDRRRVHDFCRLCLRRVLPTLCEEWPGPNGDKMRPGEGSDVLQLQNAAADVSVTVKQQAPVYGAPTSS